MYAFQTAICGFWRKNAAGSCRVVAQRKNVSTPQLYYAVCTGAGSCRVYSLTAGQERRETDRVFTRDGPTTTRHCGVVPILYYIIIMHVRHGAPPCVWNATARRHTATDDVHAAAAAAAARRERSSASNVVGGVEGSDPSRCRHAESAAEPDT